MTDTTASTPFSPITATKSPTEETSTKTEDTRDVVPVKMFQDKLKQAQHLPTDKDRMRMITNFGSQYLMTPEQACMLAKTFLFFGQTIEAIATLENSTTNHDDFIHMALDMCQFPEDRVAMCAMLEIEFIPLPEKKNAPRAKPRKTINSGLGGGHAYLS
jgi:hypothetical protein